MRVWRAILLAPGFPPKFASWWPQRANATGEEPWFIPTAPPGFAIASAILQQFTKELAQCEVELKSQREQQQKVRYQNDANRIFRDVKKPGAQPVQVLVANHQATILEVPSLTEVVTQNPLPDIVAWQSTQGQHQVKTSSDTITEFTHPHGLVQGDTICSTELLGSTEEIHQAFQDEWVKRWDKHIDLPPNHWQEINAFIDLALPNKSMECPPITLEAWKQVVKGKKARSAVGMDGVSRQDLEACPDQLHLEIISLLETAERTGQWPHQLLHGAVRSLAKRPDAESTGDFRPITILPMIYRCWSSLRAAAVLKHIEALAPPTMLGSLPGRSAPAIWYSLQAMIEQCLQDGDSCSRVVTDLIKAFNGLPREPIFRAAIQIGISPQIIRALIGAVTGITRHLYVRGEPGPGIKSCTGFPEGCPLSVAAMCLCNMLIHSFMSVRCPRTMMISYVDNVELLSNVPADAVESIDILSNFTEFLGVPTDPKKTYTWSLDTSSRKMLRQAEQTVKRNQPDLGAHLQYSGQQTNGTVKKKCQDLQSLWARLAQSQAPLQHKYKVLTAVAWPRAFHSASTVHLTDSLVQELRAGAMKGLRLDKAGANAVLQFSLSTNTMLDPGYFLLWDSLSQFRRFANLDVAHVVLSMTFWQPDRLKKPGPCGVLAARLLQIGWSHLQGYLFLDQEGQQIDIVQSPIQELKARAKRAWQQKVGSEWAARKGLRGLQFVDVPTSTQPVPDASQEEAGLIRALQNGTFMTQDHFLGAKQTDNDACKFCHLPDSLEHRHWQCVHTAWLRKQLSTECQGFIQESPPCTRERGWLVEPDLLRQFRKALQGSPTYLQTPAVYTTRRGECLDLFTDGSCLSPGVPQARLAAWAVTQAIGHPMDNRFGTVACGGLPGQWQTILRAEILAVITAVGLTNNHSGPVRIWCDNALVVRRFRQMQQGKFVPKPSKPDHDLWTTLATGLTNCSNPIEIFKVASHQALEKEDEMLAWVFAGNQSADRAAFCAMSNLPHELLQLQQAVHDVILKHRRIQRELHTFYAKVGMVSVTWQESEPSEQCQKQSTTQGREPIQPTLKYPSTELVKLQFMLLLQCNS